MLHTNITRLSSALFIKLLYKNEISFVRYHFIISSKQSKSVGFSFGQNCSFGTVIIFTEFSRFSKMECQEQSLLFFHGQKIEFFQALFPRQLSIRMQIEENY